MPGPYLKGGIFVNQIDRPADLPPVPASRLLIKKSEPIVALIFTLLVMLFINLDIQAVGIYSATPGSSYGVTPLFSDLFQHYLPWIDLSLALVIILEIGKLIFGRWNWPLLAGSVAQKVFGLIVSLNVFASAAIFNSAFFVRLDEVTGGGINWPANLPDTVSRIIVIVIIIGFVIDMLSLAWKGVRLLMEQAR
jgi:hypothetical protein